MLYEKKKLLIHRAIWFTLLLIGIIIPIALTNAPTDNVEIVDDNGYINYYYESLDKTNCKIEVTFNVKVDSGYITVAFYDSNNRLLSKENGYFYGYNKTLSSTFSVDGKVDSYEILDYDISVYNDTAYFISMIFIYIDIVIFMFFISSLLLSYKAYDYYGCEIVVYAGWYHHYIKVNGRMVDEHNTLISFTPISLSCTLYDGTDIEAIITMSNRISLKINNQLYTNYK